MNDKYMWAVAAFVVGVMVAKNAKSAKAADTTAHNDVKAVGDWWTYPGMWSAG